MSSEIKSGALPPTKQMPSYLNPDQQRLVSDLIDRRLGLIAKAYEAVRKIKFLYDNQKFYELEILSDEMTTCIVAHLSREMLNLLGRDIVRGKKVDYPALVEDLKTGWLKYGLSINGDIPPYKIELPQAPGDILFPREPVAKVAELIDVHNQSYLAGDKKNTILLERIYGYRSTETFEFDKKLNWLKSTRFNKFAHLAEETHDNGQSYLEDVWKKFEVLEEFLMAYTRPFIDKVSELDDILRQANN